MIQPNQLAPQTPCVPETAGMQKTVMVLKVGDPTDDVFVAVSELN